VAGVGVASVAPPGMTVPPPGTGDPGGSIGLVDEKCEHATNATAMAAVAAPRERSLELTA
jgi:hypothetical protein